MSSLKHVLKQESLCEMYCQHTRSLISSSKNLPYILKQEALWNILAEQFPCTVKLLNNLSDISKTWGCRFEVHIETIWFLLTEVSSKLLTWNWTLSASVYFAVHHVLFCQQPTIVFRIHQKMSLMQAVFSSTIRMWNVYIPYTSEIVILLSTT